MRTKLRRCFFVGLFAFLLGARIANADDVGGYFEPVALLGAESGGGSVEQLRAGLGLRYAGEDFGARGGLVLEATFAEPFKDDRGVGIGGELELDLHHCGHVFGARVGVVGGPDEYRSYLVGGRYRRDIFTLSLDIGQIETTVAETHERHPVVLFGVGANVGIRGLAVVGAVALLSFLVVQNAWH